MPISSARTLISSVLFLDIEHYSQHPVVEQLAMKERFNQLLGEALRNFAADDRIVLDTGDGAAVSFLSEPENALFAAMLFRDELNARAAAPTLRVRMGINLGPVRLLKDINGRVNIIGDGINDAQRVMNFAEAGNILASRPYYEVVSRISADFAKLFAFDGTRTDKHIREHTLYAIGSSIEGPLPLTRPEAGSHRSPQRPPLATPPTRSRNPMPLAVMATAVIAGGGALALLWPAPPAPSLASIPAPTLAATVAQPPVAKAHPDDVKKAPASKHAAFAEPVVPKPSPGLPDPAEVRKVSHPLPARKPESSTPAWVVAMRKELAECSNFLCTERIRWKYCPNSNWETYAECQVQKN